MTDIDHLKKIRTQFLQFIELGKFPLDWNAINDELKNVTKLIPLFNPLKLILTSTGSVTKALEILAEKPIFIKTIFQQIGYLDKNQTDLGALLGINEGDPCNFREVWLTDGLKNYVFSISLTPIKHINPQFKEDLIRADIPIGKLIEMHHIECRREIFNISTISNKRLMDLGIFWNHLEENSLVPYRTYNIISDGRIIMCILEFFHPLIR